MNSCYQCEKPFNVIRDENSVLAYSITHLSFEPKDWQQEFKENLRNAISDLQTNDGCILLAKYGSTRDSDFVDVENALFYNVGPSVFQYVASHSLLFEKLSRSETRKSLSGLHCADSYSYYYEYDIVTISDSEKLWWQNDLIAEWRDIKIQKPNTAQKPIDYWHALKMNLDAITIHSSDIVDGQFGMEICITSPLYAHINLAAIMKPLLDGVICAFHSYKDSSNSSLDMMSKKLECDSALLINTNYGILGQEIYVRDYRNGIKWNPQDDRCNAVRLTVSYANTDDYSFNGKIFRVSSDV